MTRSVLLAALAVVLTWGVSFAPAVEGVDRAAEPVVAASPQPSGPADTTVDLRAEVPATSVTPAPSPTQAVPEIPSRPSPEGWQVAAEEGPVVGSGGRLWTYTVEVEPATGVALAEVVDVVDRALLDTRHGWTAGGDRRMQRIGEPFRADLRVVLATGGEVDARCAGVGIETNGAYSCWDGTRAMLTLRRWTQGAVPIPDLATYRTYLVNHEVGHGLGHGHVGCPGPGRIAPVMMQQTKSTDGCVANGLPHP